jgi:restriction endonuclease Mrr
MSPSQRAEERAHLLKHLGAEHVWFAPPRSNEARASAEKDALPPPVAETARGAVEAMLEKARSADPARLREVVESALSRAGL